MDRVFALALVTVAGMVMLLGFFAPMFLLVVAELQAALAVPMP